MEHDASYKLLFAHPRMVGDLLRGFIHEAWVREVDFTTLERVSGSYVSDDLRDREDDMVWRVRWGADWLYIYLLLEFQATVDRYMALRLMVYIGLLYQSLIQARQLPPTGKLPPVVPIVLYNGRRRWTAPRDVATLIEAIPGGLAHYRPRLRYALGIQDRIAKVLRVELSPRHVPDEIHAVPGVPRTLSGKKLEVPVKRILQGVDAEQAASRGSLANPDVLDAYQAFVDR